MRAGTVVVWVGLAIVAIGAVIRWAPWLVSWFGHLPGDINIRGERSRVYIPITSMLIVSIVLSVLVGLVRRGGP